RETPDSTDRTTMGVIKRGLRMSPELRRGIGVTIVLALVSGAGRVAVPVLIQKVIDDRVSNGSSGVGVSDVAAMSAVAVVVVLVTAVASRFTRSRLAVTSEQALCALRVHAFRHVHRLSLADLGEQQRGALGSRVA